MVRKLNLGCGWDQRPGYLNVDLQAFHRPDLVADVRELPFSGTARFEEVLAQDLLEHLPRLDTGRALAEWNRVLAPGGRLHLRMPDILGLAWLFALPENAAIEKQRELVQCLFGTQAYTGDWHLTTFTESLARDYLYAAGFVIEQLTHRDHWLFEIVARKVAAAGEPILELGEGFYGWEGDWREGGHVWAWGSAALKIRNPSAARVERHYRFRLTSLAERRVMIAGPEEILTVSLQPAAPFPAGAFRVSLAPGEQAEVRFETGQTATASGEGGDRRALAFAVVVESAVVD